MTLVICLFQMLENEQHISFHLRDIYCNLFLSGDLNSLENWVNIAN